MYAIRSYYVVDEQIDEYKARISGVKSKLDYSERGYLAEAELSKFDQAVKAAKPVSATKSGVSSAVRQAVITSYSIHYTKLYEVYVNYNCVKPDQPNRRIYQTMKWLEPDAFLRRQNSLNSDLVNVDVIQDHTGIELLIRNDKNPEYFTSFDDNVLVFDSYLASVENSYNFV